MEIINIMEQELLLDFAEWEKLSDTEQEKYFTFDDFVDCDYLKFKNKIIVEFKKIENTIYYMMVNYDFEIFEDTIKEILLKFFADTFKKDFSEIDTNIITNLEEAEYQNILNTNITLYYRGGVGYYYGVHKLTNKSLMAQMDLRLLKWGA